ncbi:MAG: hypothetical protein IMX03_04155 [Brockia lithotrophica]|nr:hypothetical protein [Brockia lithotrophica]
MSKAAPVRGIAIALLAAVALGMLVYPAEALRAARRGLELWANVVLPATFPFLVLAELSIAWEVPQALAVLSAPFVRALFRLPGTAAFPFLFGLFSGYPTTAKVASRLVQEGLLDRASAARLTAFLTSADPLFLGAAVATGLLGRPELTPYLFALHYGTSVGLGLFSRFSPFERRRRTEDTLSCLPRDAPDSTFRGQPHESLGRTFARAVHEAAYTLIAIGGIMTFIAVALQTAMLELSWCAGRVSEASLPSAAKGILTGLFEVTLGLAEIARSPLRENERIALVLFLLGWGGLSVHVQVAAFLAEAGVSFRAFPIYRLLHGTLSAALSFLVWPHVEPWLSPAIPATAPLSEKLLGSEGAPPGNPWIPSLGLAAILALGLALGSRYRRRSATL